MPVIPELERSTEEKRVNIWRRVAGLLQMLTRSFQQTLLPQ